MSAKPVIVIIDACQTDGAFTATGNGVPPVIATLQSMDAHTDLEFAPPIILCAEKDVALARGAFLVSGDGDGVAIGIDPEGTPHMRRALARAFLDAEAMDADPSWCRPGAQCLDGLDEALGAPLAVTFEPGSMRGVVIPEAGAWGGLTDTQEDTPLARKYFGTDGIRGRVGQMPLTPEGMSRLAQSAARWALAQELPDGQARHLVVMGGDTRNSREWIENILAGTLAGMGLDVDLLGIAPTPAVASEAASRPATLGIAITASHNPHPDNGVKFFGHDGFKLADADEAALEAGMARATGQSAPSEATGTITPGCQADNYARQLRASLPGGADLRGLKWVIDGAHGAAVPGLERLLVSEDFAGILDAPIVIGGAPDGMNINAGVGATHTDLLARKTVEAGAYAGVALDGDADRIIMVDETGAVIDGDQLIALLATAMQADGRLTGGGVVTTVMSNLGLERHLATLGLSLIRTAVGDRHVVEAMRAGGYNLGGEQSGHLVMLDHATTGDGLLAALHVLAIAAADGRPFSQIARVFDPVPQNLVNVRFTGPDPMQVESVKTAISEIDARLGDDGRVLVRKSGTEPLIRIMAEAVDPAALDAAMADLERAVQGAIESE